MRGLIILTFNITLVRRQIEENDERASGNQLFIIITIIDIIIIDIIIIIIIIVIIIIIIIIIILLIIIIIIVIVTIIVTFKYYCSFYLTKLSFPFPSSASAFQNQLLNFAVKFHFPTR